MKRVDYIDIFERAIKISWKYKFLWFFGFFVFFGSFSFNYNFNNNDSLWIGFYVKTVVFVCLVFLYVMRILSTISLIKSSNDLAVYRNSSTLVILKESTESFWKIFFMEILLGIFLLITLLVIAVPIATLFLMGANFLGFLAFILGMIIAIPLIVLVYFLKKYAYLYIVVAKNNLRKSIEAAYFLLNDNTRESFVMAGTIVGIMVIVVIATIFLFMFILIIFGAICMFLFFVSKITALILGIIFSIILLVNFILIFSFAQSFLQIAWVLFFKKLSFIKSEEIFSNENIVVLENITNPDTI